MAQLSPTYASPGLRWGLALEDHPGAWVEFTESTGKELGIPASAGGGDEPFCVATIHFPDGTGRKPVVGYKPLKSKIKGELDHPSDRWNILCTKALGRALKRAGYPDDMTDLKALVVWRQRDAEIKAIGAGTAQVALAPAQPERALEAAAKASPEAVGSDDGDAPDTEADDSVTDAEVVEEGDAAPAAASEPPSDTSKAALRKAINGLGSKSGQLTRWAREHGYRVTKPATEAEARALIAQAEVIASGGDNPPAEEDAPAEPPAEPEAPAAAPEPEAAEPEDKASEVMELASGLSAEEAKAYVTFLKSIGLDPKSDPREWDDEKLAEVLGWLAVDQ